MALIPHKAAPNLPLAPEAYDRRYQDQFADILRLYFRGTDKDLQNVFGKNGGQFIECPSGLFFNTADQSFGATSTAYPVVYNATYLSNAVSLQSGSTSKIAVSVGGIYNFQYTGQLHSNSSSAKTAYLWIARNGTDIGYSTRAETVNINGGFTGVNFCFDIDLAAGEYIELKIAVTDTDLSLDATTASSPHPGIPSSVLSVNFIAPLPSPRPTPP